ncbi:MAG: hypothetical protein Kow0042_18060 [Calditrichia bacterium]
MEELPTDIQKKVEGHLNRCPSCREFSHTLKLMEKRISEVDEPNLTPKPEIRRDLSHRISRKKKKRQPGFGHLIWQPLRTILEYRIPVYQLMVAALLLLLIFSGVQSIRHTPSLQEQVQTYHSLQEESGLYPPTNLIDLSEIGRQKIGQSISEDSSLARYVVSM